MNSNKPIADEVNIRCFKQEKALYMKYYLTSEERRNLISKTSDQACMLFEYYLRMASVQDCEITDGTAAHYFGWTTQKVKRNRLALSKEGWYKTTRYTLTDGRKGISYYIGKEAVIKSKGRL
tara:strand:- start:127 stop:492 length:366 start_codon:yes stop_codon:yes gene_type:complete